MDGKQLIAWGFEPGPWFQKALGIANNMEKAGADADTIYNQLLSVRPPDRIGLRTNALEFGVFTDPESDSERDNVSSAILHMDHIMRLPTVKHGVLMPDVCPAGSQLGTIPVGGVVACENAIHPSMHSADICCSVMVTGLTRNEFPSRILDSAHALSHFGPGGRKDIRVEDDRLIMGIIEKFETNPFLRGLENYAMRHYMTQGDGNHFFFVGESSKMGQVIVTHHGSRGLGAELYKRGKAAAIRETKKIAERIPDHQAWIPANTDIGIHYWQALQIVREWTNRNHYGIHRAVLGSLGIKMKFNFWNEHNFVFQKSDGLFYHAKGSTPNYSGFASDNHEDLTLIPMNMTSGILVADVSQRDFNPKALEFAPHGAGRNMSRSAHYRKLCAEYEVDTLDEKLIKHIFDTETKGIDARFWNGTPDLSELPSAYKDADKVRSEIKAYNLAKVWDVIEPQGSIMAGNGRDDWKKFKKGS